MLRFLTRNRAPTSVYVDLDEPARKRLIADAVYQQELDRVSHVLRVSGRQYPRLVRRALVEWERAR